MRVNGLSSALPRAKQELTSKPRPNFPLSLLQRRGFLHSPPDGPNRDGEKFPYLYTHHPLYHPYGTTATPALLQLPTTLLATASNSKCLKCSSWCLTLAISYTCFMLSVPAGVAPSLPASPEPSSMPAALRMSHEVGGVLVVKVNVRSGWMVMKTGVGVPGVM